MLRRRANARVIKRPEEAIVYPDNPANPADRRACTRNRSTRCSDSLTIRLDARLIRSRLTHKRDSPSRDRVLSLSLSLSLSHSLSPIGGCSAAAFTSLQGALERRRGFFHPSSLIRKSKPAVMTAERTEEWGRKGEAGVLSEG